MPEHFDPDHWFLRHLSRLDYFRKKGVLPTSNASGPILPGYTRRAMLKEAALYSILMAGNDRGPPASLSHALLALAAEANSATATGRTAFTALEGTVATRYRIEGYRSAANYCELTTGWVLRRHPTRVAGFLLGVLERLGYRHLSPTQLRQMARLAEVVAEFASPRGFPELEKYPMFVWACPSTMSGGYLQLTEHDRKPTPPSTNPKLAMFAVADEIPLGLDHRVDGPKVSFRPSSFAFEPQGRETKPAAMELSAFQRGVVGPLHKAPFFATDEQSLLPADPGYSAQVIGPLSVRDDKLGRTKGYIDLNISLVRVVGEPTARAHGMHKLTLAFHPETLRLVQVCTNAGEFQQYLTLTPGLEPALRECLRQGPNRG